MTHHAKTTRLARSLTLALTALAIAAPASASAEPDALWLEAKGSKKRSAPSVSKLARELSPAVVNIIVVMREEDGGLGDSGDPRSGTTAVGSGFIIHPDGYVLTNNHVVESASDIKVRLNDKREYPARVVGTDPRTDVALVKITAPKVAFTAVPLGDSASLSVGDEVVAIGNPLGLNHTVTSGIISALERRGLSPGGKELDSDFIQTDASINPGNSGGPLISMSGAVIGINTAINARGQGIGFAIPINVVKKLVPQLQNRGFVERTWLGARSQELTPMLADSFGLKSSDGALISDVVSNSPAEREGLLAGDIILEFDDEVVRDEYHLPLLVAIAGADGPVPVVLMRDGVRKSFDIKLDPIPNQSHPKIPEQLAAKPAIDRSLENLGLSVRVLDNTLARQLGARSTDGVVVTSIEDASPAHASGLRRSDVILEVGAAAVSDVAGFTSALGSLKLGDVVRMRIVRGGRGKYIAFEK